MKSKISRMLGVVLPLVTVLVLAVTLFPASAPTAEAGVGTLKFENIPLPKFGSTGNYVLTPGSDVGPIAVAPDGKVMFAAASFSEGIGYASAVTTNATMVVDITYYDQDYVSSTVSLSLAVGSTSGTITLTPDTGVIDITNIVESVSTSNVSVSSFNIVSSTTSVVLGSFVDSDDTIQTGIFTEGASLLGKCTSVLKSGDGGYTWTLQSGFRTAAGTTDATAIVGIKVSPQFAVDGAVLVATQKNIYQSVDGGVTFAVLNGIWSTDETISDMDVALDRTGRLAIIVGTANTTGYAGDVYAYVPVTTGLSWKQQVVNGSSTASPTKTLNVLAAAFSPTFANDEGIFAVAVSSANVTTFRSAFGRTASGGGWAAAIGDATFRDYLGAAFAATRARIAFPSDFSVGSLTANIAFVGLCAGTEGAASEKGDVYKVTLQSLVSAATDLNIRGTPSVLTPTATNIWSIAVKGTAAAASIMVGTNYWIAADLLGVNYFTAYYSTDSGVTWANAREKSPTGGAAGAASGGLAGIQTNVVLAADFATSKIAWAATSGVLTSAISRTSDGGKSWNQISLIDYGDTTYFYKTTSMKADTMYAKTQTLWIFTKTGSAYTANGALWRSTNGGSTYERLFSYANPTGTASLYSFSVVGTGIFIPDLTSGKFFRSSDMGTSFPTIISAYAAGFTPAYYILDANTIWTAYSGGAIWSTTNGGLTWVTPTTTIVSGYPYFFNFSGKIVLVANTSGDIFISTDGGVTFAKRLGVSNAGSTTIYPAFDPGYATNKFVYANVIATSGGIWRIAVNEAAPDSTLWKRIDDGTVNPTYASVKPVVGFDLLGVFYNWDGSAVGSGAGGIWRSVNPRDDPDGLYPPKFETVTAGLTTGDVLNYAGYAVYPNTIFAFNTFGTTFVATATNYYNQLLAMADTLSAAVTQLKPADKAVGVGVTLNTTSLTLAAPLSWNAVVGALTYRWQVSTDAAFTSREFEATSAASVIDTGYTLLPGTTYYWRVRVETPLISPWSVVRSFTMGVPYALELKITSPASGALNVPVKPTFVWTAVPGVTTYELVVSEDPTFAIIDFSRTSDKAYFQADEALKYSTTYSWKVRQAGGSWVFGIFTTEAKPVPPTSPFIITQPPATTVQVNVPAPVEAVPGYLLWIIIAIGAVLVIALIVLIVRTRRAA